LSGIFREDSLEATGTVTGKPATTMLAAQIKYLIIGISFPSIQINNMQKCAETGHET
jgi:hypothetical protein